MQDSIDALRLAAKAGEDYLRKIPGRRVYPDDAAIERLSGLEMPMPQQGNDPADSLAALANIVEPATVSSVGGRYFGFVTGGCLPAALGADVMLSAWDNCASSFDNTPGLHMIERVAGIWVKDILGLPSSAAIGFPTCTTTGEIALLAAARRQLLLNQGWDERAKGLFGAPRLRIILSEEVHATMFKVLSLLGIGTDMIEYVPVDKQGRMRADALPVLDNSCLLCLQAGNVNSGAFDPFDAIIPAARKAGAWIHVDGAFGLWAAACPDLASLTRGVEAADSWIVDGHKFLNTPYDGAMAICRDPHILPDAMGVQAAYLPESGMVPMKDMALEFSRRGRGMPVWAALHSLGKDGVADLVLRCHQRAQQFADGLQAAGCDVLNDVVLNQVVFTPGDTDKRDRFLQAIEKDGTTWFGPTQWQGKAACRISVSSWKTTAEDVELALEAIRRALHT